jgi:tetratricopeptide (TPR) repeat protein
MIEPRRLDPDDAADAVRRDSQTEALLVDGLDRYFTGRYEDAIHLWTRVLFLDRSHARARAYIDRARTAIAERQRRSDEMLEASRDLIDRGETTAARTLLTEAVAETGDDEHAAALRLRLERVERARTTGPGRDQPAAPRRPVPGWVWPPRSQGVTAGLVIGSLTITALMVLGSPVLRDLVALGADRTPLAASPAIAPLPVLSSADVALVRARTLYARGRLAEALVALDRVGPDSPARPAADRLRIEIQQLLLESGRVPAPADRAAGVGRR